MRSINNLTLALNGESESRIGSLTRKVPYKAMAHIEQAIITRCPLNASADVSPIHPPFFQEFTYSDMLCGISLRTFSAEINARIAIKNIGTIPCQNLVDRFMANLDDKYKLKPTTIRHEKIVFLCGHNIFDAVVDSQSLFRFMDENPDAVIKPHPLTSEGLLRNLGMQFGYHRILDHKESGFDLLQNCSTVVGLPTSELSIVAILLGKKFIDISQYMNNWGGVASPYLNAIASSQEPKSALLATLLAKNSGFILRDATEDEITSRIDAFVTSAMSEREVFNMVTSQRLSVSQPGVLRPKP